MFNLINHHGSLIEPFIEGKIHKNLKTYILHVSPYMKILHGYLEICPKGLYHTQRRFQVNSLHSHNQQNMKSLFSLGQTGGLHASQSSTSRPAAWAARLWQWLSWPICSFNQFWRMELYLSRTCFHSPAHGNIDGAFTSYVFLPPSKCRKQTCVLFDK